MADSIRGDGLVRAHGALALLEADPQLLDRQRTRFSDSPPPYRSNQSLASTLLEEPDAPSEEQARREEQQRLHTVKRTASMAWNQFRTQVQEEMKRLWKADPRVSSEGLMPAGLYEKDAENAVIEDWKMAGTWNNWETKSGIWRWRHEEPPESESESETDTETELSPRPFFAPPQPKLRRPKSDEERRRIAERRAVRERERDASRPFYQFIYQMSKDREQILVELGNRGIIPTDINTMAYHRRKKKWQAWHIWYRKWDIMPGMLWPHEEPPKDESDSTSIQANPIENGNHEVGETSISRILEPPFPAEPNGQTSNSMSTSQQGLSAAITSSGLINGGVEVEGSEPINSSRVRHSSARQMPQSTRRKPSRGKQIQPEANTSLGAIHSSRVLKAVGKKTSRPRRPQITPPKASFDDPTIPSRLGMAEQTIIPRRSKRIQSKELSMAKGLTGITSAESPMVIAQSRPKRNVVQNPEFIGASKPQGISKKQRSSTTRRKARKHGN